MKRRDRGKRTGGSGVRDPILKERMYGLAGNQGNHGEDVKEYYYAEEIPESIFVDIKIDLSQQN